ncbi:MAG: hypothetical protein ACI9TV_002965 [Sulfurimonas sp.]|uniref:DUF4214 domain-containing protein n=1 Tax=Sulfurimonas sp. TaxID=2022749 RepID=UPI0039E4CC2E
MKNILKLILIATLSLATLEAREVSIENKITSLYISFFNRAADAEGLTHWSAKGEELAIANKNPLDVLKELAGAFAQHPVFESTYGNMDNESFVQAIYQNSLGKEGDAGGVAYWKGLLDSGTSRSDMIAEFMNASLTVDLTLENFPELSAEQLAAAQERQDLITNKVEVAVYFTKNLGTKTNVVDSQNPTSDPAYLASIKVISGVGIDKRTVTTAKQRILGTVNDSDSISLINNDWENLEEVTIIHNGINYKTVTSTNTGRIWLDKNLGAMKVCDKSRSDFKTDYLYNVSQEECFGEHYQWEGGSDAPTLSEKKEKMETLQSNSDGAWDPCPVGSRLPSIEELLAENISNYSLAHSLFNIPLAGKGNTYGASTDDGSEVYLLSSSTSNGIPKILNIQEHISSWKFINSKNTSASVRCLKIVAPAVWTASEWGSCSGSCGTDNAIQTRKLECTDSNGDTINNDYCSNEEKPELTRQCTEKECPAVPEISEVEDDNNEIISPITSRIWLDKNVGASRVCTSSTDSDCFGDYYQWGRLTNGHEKANSQTNNTKALVIDNHTTNFIIEDKDWLTSDIDNNGSLRNSQWSVIDGTSVCPAGYRVPTFNELSAETNYTGVENNETGAVKIVNAATALQNFLKFPAPGYRHYINGSFYNSPDGYGALWTSTPSPNPTSQSFDYGDVNLQEVDENTSYIEAGNDLVLADGGVSFGTLTTITDEDDDYQEIDITSVFPNGINFFGHTYNDIFIGTNGYVTFGHDQTSYDSAGIAGYTDGPMIASQYDDIDMGESANVSPNGTSTGSNELYYHLDAVNGIITITWDDIAPYENNGDSDAYYIDGIHYNDQEAIDVGNAHQIRLHRINDTDFAIEIRYENISWMGGYNDEPATAGWTAGDEENYGEVSVSGTDEFINVENYSNINHPGVFAWKVINGNTTNAPIPEIVDRAYGLSVRCIKPAPLP